MYASVEDVQSLAVARKIGQGNNPTETDVETYLALSESEINGILVNKGYVVPVAESTQALATLRRINAEGAVAKMEEAIANGPNQASSEARYQRSLQSLASAMTVLLAPKNIERSKPRGPGVTNVRPPVGEEPFFTREDQF